MRRLYRPSLSSHARGFLERRTEVVCSDPEPEGKARGLWRHKRNRAFDEIRSKLRVMASGLERCMYCEDSEGTDIDHFWPKAVYPELAFDWLNYLLACTVCNSNYKRDELPLDVAGRPLLIDPSAEDPLAHLVFSPTTGRFEGISPKGDESIRVFGLNRRRTLVEGRRNAWNALQALLICYGQVKSSDHARASELAAAISGYPFSSILVILLKIAQGPDAVDLVVEECLEVLEKNREIFQWL